MYAPVLLYGHRLDARITHLDCTCGVSVGIHKRIGHVTPDHQSHQKNGERNQQSLYLSGGY